jgi:hypothetical protein
VIPTRDHFISPAYYERAGRRAPALRRRMVPTTHWLPRTEPELLAGWIAQFVDDVEAGSVTGSRPPWMRGGGIE